MGHVLLHPAYQRHGKHYPPLKASTDTPETSPSPHASSSIPPPTQPRPCSPTYPQAFTVSVNFYLLTLPPAAWLIPGLGGPTIAVICHCMALSTYLSCAVKDALACPRPGAVHDKKNPDAVLKVKASSASQTTTTTALVQAASLDLCGLKAGVGSNGDVAILENHGDKDVEWGAPSMHTWCSLTLPACWAWVLYSVLKVIDAQTCGYLMLASAAWAAWVGLTRMYLGVHSPIDLKLGFGLGAVFMAMWCVLGNREIQLVTDTWWGVWAVAAGHLLIMATYPRPAAHTTSFGYTAIFLGASLGALFGIANHDGYSLVLPYMPQITSYIAQLPPAATSPASFVLAAFALLFAVKELSQVVLDLVLPLLFGLIPTAIRVHMQPAIHRSGCWFPEGADRNAKIVLMKTPKLAWDVDFARKVLNYCFTVYVAVDVRHIIEAIRAQA